MELLENDYSGIYSSGSAGLVYLREGREEMIFENEYFERLIERLLRSACVMSWMFLELQHLGSIVRWGSDDDIDQKAYCVVAVRVLENEGLGRYFELVKKIWRDAREMIGPSFFEVVCDDDEVIKVSGFGWKVDEDGGGCDQTDANENSHDQTNATEASLKERNNNVQDESTDGAAGCVSRDELPIVAYTPKKSVVSPVKRDESPKPLRRKRKP
ncbi:hypothetical protein AgCh_037728 [Apium graveolens]